MHSCLAISQLPALSVESKATYSDWIESIRRCLDGLGTGSYDALDPMTIGSIESTLKQIRNTLIGNLYMKQNFVDIGMLPIVRTLLSINANDAIKYGLLEWHIHALTIVGTLAKGLKSAYTIS